MIYIETGKQYQWKNFFGHTVTAEVTGIEIGVGNSGVSYANVTYKIGATEHTDTARNFAALIGGEK
jgi:hypothetical protein